MWTSREAECEAKTPKKRRGREREKGERRREGSEGEKGERKNWRGKGGEDGMREKRSWGGGERKERKKEEREMSVRQIEGFEFCTHLPVHDLADSLRSATAPPTSFTEGVAAQAPSDTELELEEHICCSSSPFSFSGFLA